MRTALAAVLLALAATGACAAEYRSIGDRAAILYDAPSARADRLFVASRLYPFEVLVKLEQWTKVRDAGGEVAWVENASLGDRHTVMVTAPVADVRAGADPQASVVFQAYKQVVLELLEPAANGWAHVRHADGQEGWVRTDQVWGA